MIASIPSWTAALAMALATAGPCAAQDAAPADGAAATLASADGTGRVARMGPHTGEMTADLSAMGEPGRRSGAACERLVFEPWQMLDDLFRDDVVLLMRHGPTDWSVRDAQGVAATDCANQRRLSPEGRERMVALGILMAGNELRPGRVVVSQWCRNQETVAALREGFAMVDAAYAEALEVRTDPAASLLLSLGGPATVTALRALISGWPDEAEAGGLDGPLLVVSHFTDIAELTEFDVYEGEALVLDPARGNRVLGYLRLASAAPDVGHFDTTGEPG